MYYDEQGKNHLLNLDEAGQQSMFDQYIVCESAVVQRQIIFNSDDLPDSLTIFFISVRKSKTTSDRSKNLQIKESKPVERHNLSDCQTRV